jgi:predicted MFS family arabinose efflux permease
LTGTPLAWLVEHTSWRIGFVALAICSAGAWLAILLLVHEPASGVPPAPASAAAALRGYGALFRLPHTAGILLLAFFTYAAFLSLRGLWLGPLLIERHGFSLVQSGHVALAVSVVGMAAPPLFGRLDPGPTHRRAWIIGLTLVCATLFGAMAYDIGPWFDVAVAVAIGLVSGYIILQYADVRAAYPASMTGRAMSVFTMAMFVGVAVVQWLTGAVAAAAPLAGVEPFLAVLATLAGLLVAAGALFRWLPGPSLVGLAEDPPRGAASHGKMDA